jgi:hypothetical protein
VLYRLSGHDAVQVTRRRTDARSVAARLDRGEWHQGAQAHIGASVEEGQRVPLLIIRVHRNGKVNGKAELDGSDVLWVTERPRGREPGTWSWGRR